MDTNLLWQYLIVLAIVIAAIVKIITGLRKAHKKNSSGSCFGCSLADTCRDYRVQKKISAGTDAPAEDKENIVKRDCHK